MQYDEFISRVQEYANLDSPDDARRLTEVFLSALGEPLGATETTQLTSELPKELKAAVTANKPRETAASDVFKYDLEEFYNRIKGRLDVPYHEGVRQAQAAARVLKEAVSSGQINDIVQELPDGWNALFRG